MEKKMDPIKFFSDLADLCSMECQRVNECGAIITRKA